MSLNFDLTKIKNFKTVCFDGKKLRPKTEALIWASLNGFSRITEKNWSQVYANLALLDKLYGKEEQFSPEFIYSHIGLTTNATGGRKNTIQTVRHKLDAWAQWAEGRVKEN